MVRSILSVLVGYLTLSVSVALLFSAWLSGAEHTVTNEFMTFAAVCGFAFAVLSGYITGIIAQRAPFAHTAGLAMLSAAIWVASTFGSSVSSSGSQEPLAFQIANLAVVVSGVLIGGYLLKHSRMKDSL